MPKIHKITTGFVIQDFDTEKEKFVGQNFIASDQVDIENNEGNPVSEEIRNKVSKCYLPFQMLQPDE